MIEAYRGDAFSVMVAIDDESTPSGMADLTGCTLLLDVKESIDQYPDASEASALIQKTQACTDDPTSGKQEIKFVKSDTENLAAEIVYTIAVKMMDANNAPHTVVVDQLLLHSEVVRRDS